jgi:hypothetical protein
MSLICKANKACCPLFVLHFVGSMYEGYPDIGYAITLSVYLLESPNRSTGFAGTPRLVMLLADYAVNSTQEGVAILEVRYLLRIICLPVTLKSFHAGRTNAEVL